MKILSSNIISIEADEEETNFPASYLLTSYQNQFWEATSGDAVVTATVSVSGGVVAVFNSNAETCTVTVTDMADAVVYGPVAATITNGNIWHEYTAQVVSHKVILTMTASTNLIAGIVVAGDKYEFSNPQYGMKYKRANRSIITELRDGSQYVTDMPKLREYSIVVLIADADLTTFDTFYDEIGRNPFAALIIDSDYTSLMWGAFMDDPNVSRDFYGFNTVTINMQEYR